VASEATEKLQDNLESQIGDLKAALTLLQNTEVQQRSQAICK
jgi:hypothetical protein